MKRIVYSDRIGVRVAPLRVTGATTTVTFVSGRSDYSSVTLVSSVFTCTPRYSWRLAPMMFGCAGTTSAGGYVTFSDVAQASFKANSLDAAGSAADNTINVLPVGFSSGLSGSYQRKQIVNFTSPYFVDCWKVQGTSTAALLTNKSRATLTDNGTGDYTITMREQISSAYPLVFGTAVGTTAAVMNVASIGPSSINVKTYNAAGSLADADFYLWVFCPVSSYGHGNNRTPLDSTQNRGRFEVIQIDVTGGVPALTYAPLGTTIADTGDGVYTVTWGKPFAREPYCLVGNQKANVSATSTTSVVVRTFDAGGSAADPSTPIYLLVHGFDDAKEYY